jgi:hypothetical protein
LKASGIVSVNGIAKREPIGNRAVIRRGAGIGLARHADAEGGGGRAVIRRHFLQQCGVIGGIGEDRHKPVVLRGRAHHRRAADVDVLDDLFAAGALGHGRFKRVEVDHHQIDRADPVGMHRGDMFGVIAQRQQAAVNGGVQGLHPPVHHFRKAGQIGHVLHGEARIAQSLGGAAGADQLHAPRRQCRAQFRQTAFVGH